jgi:hypothetical protein
MAAVKYILCYVKHTIDYGLLYQLGGEQLVHGFTDADWAACPETCRSIGRFCFTMAGLAITWQSKR